MQLNKLETSKNIENEAWQSLENSILYYKGQPVGTLAAYD